MAKIIYNKLVRDKIPEIIEADGHTAVYESIEDKNEYLVALLLKLVEEVRELDEVLTEATQEDDEAVVSDMAVIEELADVLTVFVALSNELSSSSRNRPFADAVLQQVQTKAVEKGLFNKRIFLREVIEKESVE